MEGALGSEARGVGAPRVKGSSVPYGPCRFGGAAPGARQRASALRPSGSCAAEQARSGLLHTRRRGSPLREGETQRSWRARRTIVPPPGAGRAGNSLPASATSSPLSARVSARVMGWWSGAPSDSRERRARELRDRWVLVATSRLQRSPKSISQRTSVETFGSQAAPERC
jgi:hypothetical protein